jgi:hypothetical protein
LKIATDTSAWMNRIETTPITAISPYTCRYPTESLAPSLGSRIRAGDVLKIVVSRDGHGSGKRAVAARE